MMIKPSPKPEDLALAKRAAAAIRKLYPEAEVILYGARARGVPEPESDLDLLILTTSKLTLPQEILIDRALLPLEIEAAVIICPIMEYRSRWSSEKIQGIPLAQAIKREGVAL
jgi:predicted nucleotidyltransferase